MRLKAISGIVVAIGLGASSDFNVRAGAGRHFRLHCSSVRALVEPVMERRPRLCRADDPGADQHRAWRLVAGLPAGSHRRQRKPALHMSCGRAEHEPRSLAFAANQRRARRGGNERRHLCRRSQWARFAALQQRRPTLAPTVPACGPPDGATNADRTAPPAARGAPSCLTITDAAANPTSGLRRSGDARPEPLAHPRRASGSTRPPTIDARQRATKTLPSRIEMTLMNLQNQPAIPQTSVSQCAWRRSARARRS